MAITLLMNVSQALATSATCHDDKKGQDRAVRLVSPSVVSIRLSTPGGDHADGAGFVWDRAGHIVTNHHVVAAGFNPVVVLPSGKHLAATVIGDVPELDVAVITVRRQLPKPIKPANEALRQDQVVLTIGNPLGRGLSALAGRITSLSHDIVIPPGIPLQGLIETTLPLVPGNSGGPVFDCNGHVLGMAAAVLPRADGSGNAGYAIPATRLDMVVAAAADAERARKDQSHPGLGLMLTNDSADRLVVADVVPKAPGALADVRAGDILFSANGHPVKMISDFDRELGKAGHGHILVLGLVRADKKIIRRVPLNGGKSRSEIVTPKRHDHVKHTQASPHTVVIKRSKVKPAVR